MRLPKKAIEKELDRLWAVYERGLDVLLAQWREQYIIPFCDRHRVTFLAGNGTRHAEENPACWWRPGRLGLANCPYIRAVGFWTQVRFNADHALGVDGDNHVVYHFRTRSGRDLYVRYSDHAYGFGWGVAEVQW